MHVPCIKDSCQEKATVFSVLPRYKIKSMTWSWPLIGQLSDKCSQMPQFKQPKHKLNVFTNSICQKTGSHCQEWHFCYHIQQNTFLQQCYVQQENNSTIKSQIPCFHYYSSTILNLSSLHTQNDHPPDPTNPLNPTHVLHANKL